MDGRYLHRPDRPPRVRPVPITDGGAGALIASGQVRLFGWSLQNTAAAGNTLVIKDNTANSGLTLITIPIAASSFNVSMPAQPGVIAEIGLFAIAGAASITGVVYIEDESEVGYGRREQRDYAEVEVGTGGEGITDLSGGIPHRHLA